MSTPTKRRKQAATALRTVEPPKADQSAAKALPEWCAHTPEEMFYTLNMGCEYASDLQAIEMSRQEFVALKQRLAELRGIPFDAERAA